MVWKRIWFEKDLISINLKILNKVGSRINLTGLSSYDLFLGSPPMVNLEVHQPIGLCYFIFDIF